MRALQAVEFITHLAKCEPVHKHEEEAFVQWYLKVRYLAKIMRYYISK